MAAAVSTGLPFLSFCFFFFLGENLGALLKKIAPGSLIGDDPPPGRLSAWPIFRTARDSEAAGSRLPLVFDFPGTDADVRDCRTESIASAPGSVRPHPCSRVERFLRTSPFATAVR